MNCKPGDLAVVVRSVCGNEGKVVRCVRMLGKLCWAGLDGGASWEDTWEIDPPLKDVDGNISQECPDSILRPIRDPGEDAQDETLTWKPVPLPEIA